MIKNYDQEIEKMYHPENFETFDSIDAKYDDVEECPSCHEKEYRAIMIGNNQKGWHTTGYWECDSCYYQDKYPMPRDINPKTGKISKEHLDTCNGCSLCEGDK